MFACDSSSLIFSWPELTIVASSAVAVIYSTLLHVDKNKVAALGFSAGGELAAFLGVTVGNSKFEGDECNLKSSSAVNAIVDLDGTLSFVHPESVEGDDSKKTSAATYWFGYSKKENITGKDN